MARMIVDKNTSEIVSLPLNDEQDAVLVDLSRLISGEDQVNHLIRTRPAGWQWQLVEGAGDTMIGGGAGVIHGFDILVVGDATSSVSVYDGDPAGTGQLIGAAVDATAPRDEPKIYDVLCATSIWVRTVNPDTDLRVIVYYGGPVPVEA